MPMSSHRCLQLIRHTPPEICMKNYTRLISACVTFPRKANLAACVFPLWSEINVHPCPQSFDPYYTGNWVSGSYTGICFPFLFFLGWSAFPFLIRTEKSHRLWKPYGSLNPRFGKVMLPANCPGQVPYISSPGHLSII